MTVAVLRPASLSFGLGSAGGHTSTLVGGQTALSDDSDGTYAEVWGYGVSGVSSGNDFVHAALPAVADLRSLTAVGPLSVRLWHDLTPGPPLTGTGEAFAFAVFNTANDFLGQFERNDLPPEATVSTVTDWTFSEDSASASFATALQAGTAWVALGVPINLAAGTFDWQMRYYELALTVDYVSATSHAPACRKYPREDRLGVGSGRHYPPPRSQQFSARRAGGYY